MNAAAWRLSPKNRMSVVMTTRWQVRFEGLSDWLHHKYECLPSVCTSTITDMTFQLMRRCQPLSTGEHRHVSPSQDSVGRRTRLVPPLSLRSLSWLSQPVLPKTMTSSTPRKLLCKDLTWKFVELICWLYSWFCSSPKTYVLPWLYY